ncbi:MAG: SUMO protein smt3, partial [Paramarteilia canceri]
NGIVKQEDPSKTEESSEHVMIKLMDQNGSGLTFKIKKTTPLEKLFKNYSERVKVAQSQLRFIHNVNRIDDKDTAESLGIKNNDKIDVFTEQVGGVCNKCLYS